MTNSFYIPPKNILAKTSPSDPIEWYYKPIFGYAYRKRLALALDALGDNHDKLLEVGYASGILLRELFRHCKELHATDIHKNISPVQDMLKLENVSAKLTVGSILELEYDSDIFDALICLSVLEFMNKNDLEVALKEVHRVTKSGGRIILGFPKYSKTSDLIFRLFGLKPVDLYHCSYMDIEMAIKNEFPNAQFSLWPSIPNNLSIYSICTCES